MHLNYKNLAAFAANPQSRNKSASSASEVLSSYYMGLISSLIYEGEKITESEMAVISMSIGRWLKSRAKTKIVTPPVCDVGSIVQIEWGTNFSPEISYGHPAVIIEDFGKMVLVIPTTSTPSNVQDAYHPTDNPDGKWYYRKVGTAEGFAHECALILNNAKILSKSRIISVSGKISGDINHEQNVFREIRRTMLQKFFAKEWIEQQKIIKALEDEKQKNKELQEKYDKLLAENEKLKSEI